MTMDNFREEDMPKAGVTRAAEFKGDDGFGDNPPAAISQVEERPYPLPEIAATSTPGNLDDDGQQLFENDDLKNKSRAMLPTQSGDNKLPEGEAEHLDTHSELADEVAESGNRLGYNEHDTIHEGEVIDTIPGNPNNPAIETTGDADFDDEPGDAVPSGSSNDVLEWVGDDKARAQKALDKESQSGSPRKGLTSKLNEVLASEDTDSE